MNGELLECVLHPQVVVVVRMRHNGEVYRCGADEVAEVRDENAGATKLAAIDNYVLAGGPGSLDEDGIPRANINEMDAQLRGSFGDVFVLAGLAGHRLSGDAQSS